LATANDDVREGGAALFKVVMVKRSDENPHTMAITLPWPPSANTHWRSTVVGGKPRVLISKQGRKYRQCVLGEVLRKCGQHAEFDYARSYLFKKPLKVQIDLFPPDKRRRDIDNSVKPLLDALMHGGAFDDDSQVAALDVRRRQVEPPGRVYVWIEEAQLF